ncbi:MAG TPA: PcfJ domain-containing protein [Chthonomonadaceae bacterium]|nr:PcfJ domain-containing protein [Chthonomonadaceae bacterium]
MKRAATKTTYPVTATSLPGARLDRHIASLGLADRLAYRRWCRDQGFGAAPFKHWRRRSAERLRAKRLAAEARDRARLEAHVARLGLTPAQDYASWCRAHDWSASPRKSERALARERETVRLEAAVAALTRAREGRRRPDDIVRAIFAGAVDSECLRTAAEHDLFKVVGALKKRDAVRDALLRLILRFGAELEDLAENPYIADIGWDPANSLLAALGRIADLHDRWIAQPEDWKGEYGGPRRRFGSLVRWLFTPYQIPAFMDRAWFEPEACGCCKHVDLFLALADGRNLRAAAFMPIALTKRMAHCAMRAPAELTIDAAMRWGQVRGMGGTVRTARAILSTRLADPQEDEPFWATVVQFFVSHVMLDPAQIRPIVDYLHAQKFVPVDVRDEAGEWIPTAPAQPALTMKGRSPVALVRQVQEWRRALALEKRPQKEWSPSGVASGVCAWSAQESDGAVWTVQELLSVRELHQEGRYMHHCVATYAGSCASGNCSIWSLRRRGAGDASGTRVLTIEVRNRTRTIVQARGRFNYIPRNYYAPPTLKASDAILRRWAERAGLKIEACAC